MQKKVLLIALGLYLVSAVASYGVFAALGKNQGIKLAKQTQQDVSELVDDGMLLEIDPAEPKTEVCPLNGELYTKTEKNAWQQRRPLAVMLENHPEARPQSGLSQAEIVFETIAEGGVTRFMGLFLCNVQRNDVVLAPIRSARTYFVDWASGFNWPLYTHVGGANTPGPADALGQISDYGWNGENDLNQFSIGYPVFVRDYNRLGKDKELATEHTMVTSTQKLWDYAEEEREWTNFSPDRKITKTLTPKSNWYDGYTGWTFAKEAKGATEVTKISYDFWSGYNDYSVRWEYDSATNSYKRFMAGEAHLDLNNNEQIAARNVIVILTTEKGPIDEKKHMLYQTTGTGNALIFNNGQVIKGTWSKEDREAELEFLDGKGKVVELTPGQIWISVIDKGNEVAY